MQKDEFDFDDEPSGITRIAIIVATVVILLAVAIGVYIFFFSAEKTVETDVTVAEDVFTETESVAETIEQTQEETTENITEPESETQEITEESTTEPVVDEIAEDPQNESNMVNVESGAATDVSQILIGSGAVENAEATLGIDVSRYQGTIDWALVAQSGIDYAMIRVGYRTMKTGEIVEDSNARYNLQEANANGIKVGAYFFSAAVSEAEAVEEAKWTKKLISGYRITYPVAYDCEGYENPESRQYGMTREERSGFAKAFLNEIYQGGYTPMFYASKGELENDNKWLTSELEKSYKIWFSWYPSKAFPETAKADYSRVHDMWQYTNNGTVAGIKQPVDVNVAYFGYDQEAAAQGEAALERVEADAEALMHFDEVNETVTAKDKTNLRNIPSQGDDSTVMYTLQNGEIAVRTGVSPSGWSRVVFNGATYYAVSNYLTTDLTGKAPEPQDDGIKTEFTPVNEIVTPKIEVNLRALPSVTNPDAVVVATVKNGETMTRTGINTALGWSRVEYNGQVLYCVSSYVSVVGQ